MKYIYVMEYYSVIKRNKIIPSTVTWIDLKIVILNEVSQIKMNIICYHLYVESLKKSGTNKPIYKTELESQM